MGEFRVSRGRYVAAGVGTAHSVAVQRMNAEVARESDMGLAALDDAALQALGGRSTTR